jgi:hypothetical protein
MNRHLIHEVTFEFRVMSSRRRHCLQDVTERLISAWQKIMAIPGVSLAATGKSEAPAVFAHRNSISHALDDMR